MPATDDQQRVLAELESLLLAIRVARGERDASRPHFSAPRSGPSPVGGTVSVTQIEAASRSAGTPAVDAAAFTRARLGDHPAPDDRPLAAAGPHANPGDRQAPRRRLWGFAAIPALLVAGALVLVWAFNRPAGSPDQPVAPQQAAQAPGADSPPTPPAGAVRGADAHKVRIALTTVRRVWMRVTLDGRIVVEREVAAGEHLPFGADRSIVLRAGDAGAVLLRVGESEPAPLGGDGQVLTRAFAAPAR